MSEGEATEATIGAIYKAYYAEMGGAGTPPDVRTRAGRAGGGQCYRLPPPGSEAEEDGLLRPAASGGTQKRPLPVALIFACLVVVYVGIRLYWR